MTKKKSDKQKKRTSKKRASVKRTMADRADRHDLYQKSVQYPPADIAFFERAYSDAFNTRPLVMREDFCGTSLLTCAWVKTDKKRVGVGIDLDEPTLKWAKKHNVNRLSTGQKRRVELHQADVRDAVGQPADVSCALNFSFCIFKTRDELRTYFEAAHRCLKDEGVFVAELFGGNEAIIAEKEKRKLKRFTYIWDQAKYNPITNEILCYIHFRFPDGSKIKEAFTYDWRLWTIPEVRELMLEAGFDQTLVYWEGTDDDGYGSGEYYPTDEEENQAAWLVYIVGVKGKRDAT